MCVLEVGPLPPIGKQPGDERDRQSPPAYMKVTTVNSQKWKYSRKLPVSGDRQWLSVRTTFVEPMITAGGGFIKATAI